MLGAEMTGEQQDRVVVVLVRARNPNNIGAVARAMHGFGYRHLRVVSDYAVPFESARSAVHASAVLGAARVCGSLAEAVADCTLVVGTTAVGERDVQHRVYTLRDAAEPVRTELRRGGRVAVLFGSEKTGLSNEELSYCNLLLTIPMRSAAGERHLSMNLGQAAAVCLYELLRPGAEGEAVAPARASAGDLERVTELLGEVLEKSGYRQHHPANSDAATVRRAVRRMGLGPRDAPVWLGVLRQMLWKMRGGREARGPGAID